MQRYRIRSIYIILVPIYTTCYFFPHKTNTFTRYKYCILPVVVWRIYHYTHKVYASILSVIVCVFYRLSSMFCVQSSGKETGAQLIFIHDAKTRPRVLHRRHSIYLYYMILCAKNLFANMICMVLVRKFKFVL